MGRFLKIGNDGFRTVRNGEYVDKSRLIEIVNATLILSTSLPVLVVLVDLVSL